MKTTAIEIEKEYNQHWEEKFKTRIWGRYPPEDFVRFMGRNFKNAKKDEIKVLEVGSGTGANVWFLHREGFAVSAIDISATGVEIARERLRVENSGIASPPADLKSGNFAVLPWPDQQFDVVADIFALCANNLQVISMALAEIARVMKPGALFYAKFFGTETTGFGDGKEIEPGTFESVNSGPFKDMGVCHFFSRADIDTLFGTHFTPLVIDEIHRTDHAANQKIHEYYCQFKKA